MKQFFFLLIIALGILSSCKEKPTGAMAFYAEIDQKAPLNTLTDAEKLAGWKLLFDGATAAGWHGYNQQGVPSSWIVDNGTLAANSSGSEESQDLVTDKIYRSFAFTLEYKMDTATNSGVIFQIKEDTLYKFAYETGPEFQIIDQENWKGKLEDWQTNGANYAMYPPLKKAYKPAGEWNRLLLVVNGNDVTQILNGEITAKYTKYSEDWNKRKGSGKWAKFPDWGKFDEGHISLQNHGTKIWFRNIMIKELP